ncbi:MAG: hypothetical protein HPY55_05485 [Firmicutes bacterium]|nr:hypothetical protein [Bacillota bacterium]
MKEPLNEKVDAGNSHEDYVAQARPAVVAVIGPDDLVSRVLDVGRLIPALELVGMPYSDDDEAPAIYRQLPPAVDMVLFTGPVPYYRTLAREDIRLPALHVSLQGTGLYRALFQIHDHYDITRLSTDTFSRETVEEVYHELGVSASGVYSKEYRAAIDKDELVNFHENLFRRGLTSVAVTCLRSAHHELERRGVPSVRVLPTKSSIKEALEKAALIGQGLRDKASQVVVGLVDIDNFEGIARRAASEHRVQQLKLEIHAALLRYVEQIDGCMNFIGNDEFLFFTTRGMFEKSSNCFTRAPLIADIKHHFNTTVSLGVGLGYTANQAGTNARVALQHAKRCGGDACFVVTEERRVLGPLGLESRVEYGLRHIEPAVLAAAEAAGVSATAVDRLYGCVRSLGAERFSANDIAPLLGITLRSTNRLLNHLVAAGLVAPAGEEKLNRLGRPRRLYHFLLGRAINGV